MKTSAFINFMGLRGYWIFFLLMWYLGIPYTGIEDSNYYLIFWVFIAALTIYQIAGYFLKKAVPKSLFISSLLVLSVVMLFFSADMIGSRFFNLFIGTCVPCIFLGINCAINKNEEECMNYLEYLLIISLVPLFFVMWSMIQELGSLRFSFETGAGPMNIGYNSAVFFVYLAMIPIIKEREKKEYYSSINKLVRNKYFIFFTMLFLTFVVLATGSRGPLVAILIAPILLMFIYRGRIDIKTFRLIIIILIILTGLVYLIAYNPFPGFDVPLYRILLLLEGVRAGEVLEAAGSGREIIFEKAVLLFKEYPLFGSGFMGYLKEYGTYPHNIFLELLTNYGIIGSLIWLSSIFYLFAGIVKRIKLNNNTLPFYSIISVQIIGQLFSGTYINSLVLWFFIGYGISCRFDTPYPDRVENNSANKNSYLKKAS